MITHGKDVKIFTCNANPELAQKIAQCLGLGVCDAEVTMFSDGEIGVNIYETVRGSDVFIIQSTCNPVNDHLMDTTQSAARAKRRISRPSCIPSRIGISRSARMNWRRASPRSVRFPSRKSSRPSPCAPALSPSIGGIWTATPRFAPKSQIRASRSERSARSP